MYKKIILVMISMVSVFTLSISNVISSKADSTTPWETAKPGTDLYDTQTLHSGNRIYYTIKPGSKNEQQIIEAANQWNKLGIIKLMPCNWNRRWAEIRISNNAQPNSDNSIVATTFYSSNFDDDDSDSAQMTNTHIVIYPRWNQEAQVYQEISLMHEFGHALGFAHDNVMQNGIRRVMNALTIGKVFQLGDVERNALQQHYASQLQ